MELSLSGRDYLNIEEMYFAHTPDAEGMDPDDPRRPQRMRWAATVAMLYNGLSMVEKIRYYVERQARQFPHLGLSVGYIGNYERWGDDTSWRVFNKVATGITMSGSMRLFDWVKPAGHREFEGKLGLEPMLEWVSSPAFEYYVQGIQRQYDHNAEEGNHYLNYQTYALTPHKYEYNPQYITRCARCDRSRDDALHQEN